jgi:hypothetical protein
VYVDQGENTAVLPAAERLGRSLLIIVNKNCQKIAKDRFRTTNQRMRHILLSNVLKSTQIRICPIARILAKVLVDKLY